MVTFKYLGYLHMATDDDFMAVVENLWKARKKLDRISSILGREGVDVRKSGNLFKVVVLAVLISILETWVVTPQSGRTMGGFHHRVAHQITVKKPLG